MNQKELADACLMDVTTMSRTLDRMEKDGLLKRENNPVSRRSWNVLLTDYGSQKADEVIRIFNRIDNVIYNGFSEEEVQTLSVMAGKVSACHFCALLSGNLCRQTLLCSLLRYMTVKMFLFNGPALVQDDRR